MKKYSGITAITILSLVPICLWLFSFPKGTKINFDFIYVGQVFGLVGAVLLSINFILSSRLKFLEIYFGGLNKIYIIHHITGALAFSLLSFHPVLIGLSYLKYSPDAALNALLPPINVSIASWLGLFAYLTLTTLLVLTLFIRLPYHIWKITHKFMGGALILAFLHVSLIPSTVSYFAPLGLYMQVVLGIGIATYFYRTIFGRFLVGRTDYKVSEVRRLGNVTEIKLTPLSKSLVYTPGQFIFIAFDGKKGLSREEHPFSLTSSPNDEYASISPKDSGDYTSNLKSIEVGAIAHIEGPFGEFSFLHSPRKKQIWIAGGIGITPFISMIKSFTPDNGYNIKFYYVVSQEPEAVYNKLLNTMKAKLPNFQTNLIVTKSQGRLTANQVASEVADYKERDIFLCGPPPMMKSLRRQFNSLNVKNSHIYSEEFSLD